jgi:hypothetical protein
MTGKVHCRQTNFKLLTVAGYTSNIKLNRKKHYEQSITNNKPVQFYFHSADSNNREYTDIDTGMEKQGISYL